jgi:hypothetical protein
MCKISIETFTDCKHARITFYKCDKREEALPVNNPVCCDVGRISDWSKSYACPVKTNSEKIPWVEGTCESFEGGLCKTLKGDDSTKTNTQSDAISDDQTKKGPFLLFFGSG